MKYFFILVASLTAFAASADNAIVRAIRVGQHDKTTRVVFEINKPLTISYTITSAPLQVVVDIPQSIIAVRLKNLPLPQGSLVKGMRQVKSPKGFARVVLPLKKYAVASVFTIPANGEQGFRVVMDMKPEKEPTRSKSDLPSKITPEPEPIAQPEAQADAVKAKALTKRRTVVVIDPGHGGKDPGAIGPAGTYEKTVTLRVSYEIKKILEQNKNIIVHLTREGDVFIPLADRVRVAHRKGADIFVSIHADAHRKRSVRGGSVYVLSEKASDREAERITRQARVSGMVGAIDLSGETPDVREILIDLTQRETLNRSAVLAREILDRMDTVMPVRKERIVFAGFRVLKAPDVPSILVELAYLSNPQEEKVLKTQQGQRRMAKAVADGIKAYLEQY